MAQGGTDTRAAHGFTVKGHWFDEMNGEPDFAGITDERFTVPGPTLPVTEVCTDVN